MKLFILIQLLYLVRIHTTADSCVDFWKIWKEYSCVSDEIRCYKTEKLSFAKIQNNILYLQCNNESIYPQLMKCLEAKSVNNIIFSNCYMSDFHFGQFVFGVEVGETIIKFTKSVKSFDSVTFNDIPSLKEITLHGVRTPGLLNLTFDNVPSVTHLDITNHKFDTFLHRPFQHLSNLSTLKIRSGVLKTLPEDVFYGLYNLQKLDLRNNQIEEISPSVFQNLTMLIYLDLKDNKLTMLPNEFLIGLSNLELFLIERNRLNALPENLLAPCSKLILFYVSFNNIKKFPPRFFRGLPDLKYVAAIECGLASIEEGIFSDALNLTEVFLTGNNIQYLSTDLFKNNKKLEKFYVGKNKIRNLSSDIFHDLIELRKLQLSENYLESLHENAFQNLSSLEVLDLSLNRFTFLPENIFLPLTKLRVLGLSYNNLSRLPLEHPFGKSKHLDKILAKHMNLMVWPKINWTAHNLTFVDFSENNFSAVSLPIFTPNRVYVILSQSNISTIYIDTWKYGFDIPIYNLRNNIITCDCQLRVFIDFVNTNLKTISHIFPNINNFRCYKENKKLLDIWPTYTLCSIKGDCPANCECFLDYSGFLVNCSGKGLKNLPVINTGNVSVVDLRWNEINEFSSVNWSNATHLYLSNNLITDIEDLPPKVVYLTLNNNRLSQLPESLMNRIDELNEFKISLSGNHWSCGCGSGFTKEWLIRNRHKILDFSDVSCRMDSNPFSFEQVISFDKCEMKVNYFATWKIAVICVGLIIFILLFLVVIVYLRWRKGKRIEK